MEDTNLTNGIKCYECYGLNPKHGGRITINGKEGKMYFCSKKCMNKYFNKKSDFANLIKKHGLNNVARLCHEPIDNVKNWSSGRRRPSEFKIQQITRILENA